MTVTPDHADYRIDPRGERVPPPADMTSRPARDGELPVIDIALLRAGDPQARRAVGEAIARACETTGFFYVVGHGVPEANVDAAFEQARRFFEQPDEAKRAIAFNRNQRGYKAPGTIQIPGNPPDLKEVVDFSLHRAPDHPDVVEGKPLHGPNQWPDLPGFREILEGYYAAVSGVGHALLPAFASGLGLEPDYFAPFHEDPYITWRIMRYPPTPAEPGQFGTAPHSDFGTITLLAQDALGGLEIRARSGEWIEAPFVPGSFVVNIGDLMACWTNDRFTSTAHRVINRSNSARYSIPMFFNPSFDTVAECLPTCHGPDNPPRHEPIHYGQYIAGIYGRIYTPAD